MRARSVRVAERYRWRRRLRVTPKAIKTRPPASQSWGKEVSPEDVNATEAPMYSAATATLTD